MLRRLCCRSPAKIAADGEFLMKTLIDMDRSFEPMERMKIRVSRRGILRAAADAAEERRRSRNGLPSFRIEDLTKFSDQEMAEISPVVNRKAKISLADGVVYAETSSSVEPVPLFPVNSPALFVFNQFNGEQTMAEVIRKVSEHTGWDGEKSRDAVRMIFLKLCEVRVCEPGDSE